MSFTISNWLNQPVAKNTQGIGHKFKFAKIAATLGIASLVVSCASNKTQEFSTPHNQYQLSSVDNLNPRQKADLLESIIAADIAAYKGDSLASMSYYLYAAEISKSPELIIKGINAARKANDPLGLEQAAKIWLNINSDNPIAQEVFLESQLGLGNLMAAHDTALLLLKSKPTASNKYHFLIKHVQNSEPRITINVLAKLKEHFQQQLKQSSSFSDKKLKAVNDSLVAITTAQSKFFYDLSTASQTHAGGLNQALSIIDNALRINEQFIPAVRLKSNILYQLRKDSEAISFLSQLYQANPASPQISHMLGQMLYDLRNYQASANHFTGWLENHPQDIEAKYYQAASYYGLQQYHLSLDAFLQLLDESFESHRVAFFCGDSAARIKKLDIALSCFNKIEPGPLFVNAKIQSANIYAEQNNPNKAIELVSQVGNFSKDDQIKLVNAEISLLERYRTKPIAKQRLTQALKQYPEELSLLIKKIRLFDLGNQPKALYQLLLKAKDLVEEGEKQRDFLFAGAQVLRQYKHHQLAIQWFTEALIDSPDDKELLYNRALFREPLGQFNEMISEFKQLLQKYPDDLNIKNALGYTLADRGQELDYAEQLINEAFKGLPNSAAVIDSKGWIAFRKGNLLEAEKYLALAFEMQPSAEGAAHLGEVFWVSGKKDFARSVFKKGLSLDKENTILLEVIKRLQLNLE